MTLYKIFNIKIIYFSISINTDINIPILVNIDAIGAF